MFVLSGTTGVYCGRAKAYLAEMEILVDSGPLDAFA
jgi:hypothetical protein